jgi:hypothetical protein
MQILQPSFKLFQTLLTDNPELTQKYVSTSVTAISHLLGPLNFFMRHLLVVKGLDPDSNPGERAARELRQAMSQAFESHQKAYDDDYDFSWVQKRFDETRNHLKELQLTKERYLDLTNLAKLPDEVHDDGDFTLSRTAETKPYEVGTSAEVTAAVVNAIAPVSPKRETRLTALDKAMSEATKTDFGSDSLEALRAALFTVEKELQLDQKVKQPKKKNKGAQPAKKKYVPKKIVKVGDHYALKDTEKKPFDTRQQEKADLVKEMVAKGLCTPEYSAQQLQEMEKWSDTSLDALKRVIDRHQPNAINSTGDKNFKGSFRRVSSPKGI